MADYFTPTVVQQTIPLADMTPLERLFLTHVFESETDGEGLYFFSEIGVSDRVDLDAEAFRTAFAGSADVASAHYNHLAEHATRGDEDSRVEIDLSVTSWEFLFQDIVKRSPTLDHVSIVSAFTCSKMRSDGFGGMAVLITANAITGKSTNDILEDFLSEAESQAR